MRFIKLGILSCIILFFIITAISLLIPSRVRISRATNIAPPPDSVVALIKDTSRWKEWFPPNMSKDSVLVFPKINIQPLTLTDSQMVFQLWQEDRKPMVSGWKIYHHASTDSLTLQWYMDFHLSWYPWQKFGSLLFEKTYGLMMENGLSNLKKGGADGPRIAPEDGRQNQKGL